MGNIDEQKKEIVIPFQTPEFHKVWELWLSYRKEIKKPYKGVISEQAALIKLSRYSESEAIQMIMQSIENSWQGLFEIKNFNKTKQINDKQTTAITGAAQILANRWRAEPRD